MPVGSRPELPPPRSLPDCEIQSGLFATPVVYPAMRASYDRLEESSDVRRRSGPRTETQVAVLGYARVPTQAQDLEPRLRQLRIAGCTEIFEEKASGTSRTRP